DQPFGSERAIRPAPTAIVLKAAVNVVRLLVVNGDVVELPDRNVIKVIPVRGAIVANVETAITADDHVPAVLGSIHSACRSPCTSGLPSGLNVLPLSCDR